MNLTDSVLNNPPVNKADYEKVKHLMPSVCPKSNCMFVYNPERCYLCSQLEHNK